MAELVRVALLPSEVVNPTRCIAVLIDVMRATTTIVMLLERGARQIELLDTARDVRRTPGLTAPDTVVCGERPDGELLVGCDFPPSPALIRQMNLAGKTVVLKTANGTSAAFRLKRLGVKSVYIGCLNQRLSTARSALAAVEETGDTIQLVCAARERGKTIALDDAYTAGAIVASLRRLAPSMHLHDSALLALSLFEKYSAHDAFRLSSTWSRLSKTRQGADDLEHCARIDVSNLVPRVAQEAGRLFIRNEREV